jgi:hypothetical protein
MMLIEMILEDHDSIISVVEKESYGQTYLSSHSHLFDFAVPQCLM